MPAMRKQIENNFHTGDMVLGMHDALVSLTGLIAGMVGANSDRATIILTSVIASAVAALSMGASNYLAQGANNQSRRRAIASAVHTGAAYLITCVILIVPFMCISDVHNAMNMTFVMAVLIIFFSNLLIARRTKKSFWGHFIEMLAVCTGVSGAGYLIGEVAKYALGLNI